MGPNLLGDCPRQRCRHLADGQIDEGKAKPTGCGTGSQVLSGVTTYSGATLVSGGTLGVASGGAINASNSVITQGGGLLNISGGTVTVANGGIVRLDISPGEHGTGSVAVGSGGIGFIGQRRRTDFCRRKQQQ